MATVILQILLTFVLLTAWRFNPGVPGIRTWFFTYLMTSIGVVMLMLRDVSSPVVSIIGAQIMLQTAAYLVVVATRRYVGVPPLDHRYFVGALIVYSGCIGYFVYIEPGFLPRVAIFSFFNSAIYFVVVREILRLSDDARHPTRHPARYFFAGVCGLHGVFGIVRATLALAGPSEHSIDGGASGISQMVVLEGMVVSVLFALSVVLLAAEHMSENLRWLSERDPLTEAFNRRAFMTYLERAFSRIRRDGTPVAVMMIDLDHFKKINDAHGHSVGDVVLKKFTALTNENLRTEDVLGRVGGEEFAVLLPGATNEGAAVIAERVRDACQNTPITFGSAVVQFTVSIGVADVDARSGEDTVDVVMRRADIALYRAKNDGRNQVVAQ